MSGEVRTTGGSSRAELVASLERHLRARGFPRAQMLFMVSVAGAAAFLFSAITLRLGLDHMGVRYGLAALVGYASFIAMIRGWIAWQRGTWDASDGLDAVDLLDAANAFGPDLVGPVPSPVPTPFAGGSSGGGGTSGSWTGTAAPDLERATGATWAGNSGPAVGRGTGAGDMASSGFGLDDAWPLVLAVVGLALGAVAIFYAVWIAPALLAEVALDAALVATLYRRLKRTDTGTWLGATLRRTWVAGAALVVFMAIAGSALAAYAPEARSIGGVLRGVRAGAGPPSG